MGPTAAAAKPRPSVSQSLHFQLAHGAVQVVTLLLYPTTLPTRTLQPRRGGREQRRVSLSQGSFVWLTVAMAPLARLDLVNLLFMFCSLSSRIMPRSNEVIAPWPVTANSPGASRCAPGHRAGVRNRGAPSSTVRTRLYQDGNLIKENFPPHEIPEELRDPDGCTIWLNRCEADCRELEIIGHRQRVRPP